MTRQPDRRSSTRNLTRIAVVLGLLGACQGSTPLSSPRAPIVVVASPACARARERLQEAKAELEAGRLLRSLAHAFRDAACPSESRQSAALAAQASAALGDAAAVETWRKELPPNEHLPALLEPDGPVTPLSGDVEGAYTAAVDAYLKGEWERAIHEALPVGTSGSGLAVEAFILAARSAEKTQDAARAARMWARAYRAGCRNLEACWPHAPEEGEFSLVALRGSYVPWENGRYCEGGTVVHGHWELVQSDSFVLREIPTRVMLQQREVPREACHSADGEWIAAREMDYSQDREFISYGKRGEPLRRAFLAPSGGPNGISSVRHWTWVLNDGRVLFYAPTYDLHLFDPATGTTRHMKLSPPGGGREYGVTLDQKRGFLYRAFERKRPPPEAWRFGFIRYDIQTGKGKVIYESDGSGYLDLGPVNAQGRFVALGSTQPDLLWVDGTTGNVRRVAHAGPDVNMVASVGMLSPSILAWVSTRQRVTTVDLESGAQDSFELVRDPEEARSGEAPDQVTRVNRILDSLPAGSSNTAFAQFRGWKIDGVGKKYMSLHLPGVGSSDWQLVVNATNDNRGAMVFGSAKGSPDHFEFVGDVSAAFRASAWCGLMRAKEPQVEHPFWPIEVCGAAMEEPGMTERMLAAANKRALEARDGGAVDEAGAEGGAR